MAQSRARLVTKKFEYDGGRQVTAYVPPSSPELIVFASDGAWHAARLVAALEAADAAPTMVIGVHGMPDDDGRLKEYVPVVDAERFAAHERFFVHDVRSWVQTSLGVALPPSRTAVWGASLGGELALALGLRHREVYGVVLSASPGAGYRPAATLVGPPPRVYLVAGSQEQFFLDNASRWADALRQAKADVVMMRRVGSHGGAFWYEEFPSMVRWALEG
jgi:enterochelin esterase-like enzyme